MREDEEDEEAKLTLLISGIENLGYVLLVLLANLGDLKIGF